MKYFFRYFNILIYFQEDIFLPFPSVSPYQKKSTTSKKISFTFCFSSTMFFRSPIFSQIQNDSPVIRAGWLILHRSILRKPNCSSRSFGKTTLSPSHDNWQRLFFCRVADTVRSFVAQLRANNPQDCYRKGFLHCCCPVPRCRAHH